jgi:SOS response regulatory protein OraA/RecX
MEKGQEDRAIKIARNLLKKGWSVEDAAEVAELAVEKVRAPAE